MTIPDADREHALSVINWFSEASFNKYAKGIQEHGGHLPDKGGLLHEAECEILDQAIYLRTVRAQLLRIERWLEHGATEKALIAIGHVLRGTPLDLFPDD